MSENYQNSITDQICKVQTSKKLIALYDRLRYTSYNSYAQLHAKGEFEERNWLSRTWPVCRNSLSRNPTVWLN